LQQLTIKATQGGVMKRIFPFIFCFTLFHNTAFADIKKGIIDGSDWLEFNDDVKYGLVIGYMLGTNNTIKKYPSVETGKNFRFYTTDERDKILKKNSVPINEVSGILIEQNVVTHLLLIRYASLGNATAKQLVDDINAFYSDKTNRTKILEDAILSTRPYNKTTIENRQDLHSSNPILLPTPTPIQNRDSIDFESIQNSPHLKAGGSSYKDYTLPQNQPPPQPTYQQQQWDNGNGFGRYGNYPSYPR
jgi:hypothetical protein